jgi:hypothetical protein
MTAARIFILLCLLSACSEQPQREVWAVVVDIAPYSNPKWKSDELVITARAPDGAIGSKSVLAYRLSCRVGDAVHGLRQGVALTLDEKACER